MVEKMMVSLPCCPQEISILTMQFDNKQKVIVLLFLTLIVVDHDLPLGNGPTYIGRVEKAGDDG